MRRQNPPQASLDKAQNVERYFSPTVIASAYAACSVLYFVFIALLFAALVHDFILNPSLLAITIFALLAVVPAALIFLIYFRRPNDPFSKYIKRVANVLRTPVRVSPDQCVFKVLLMDGAVSCVHLTFYYPSSDQTPEVKEKLYTYVHACLDKDSSMRATAPSKKEIETAANAALELLAEEQDIPVLYVEVEDTYKLQDAYTPSIETVPTQYLGDGTLG
jgi:hypothetical protein